MKDNFYLQVSASGVGIVVELNGVPLVSELDGEGYQETQPVNMWLRKSANTLKVSLLPPVPDEEDPQPIGEQLVEVSLFLNARGAQSIQIEKMLSVFTWPLVDLPSVIPYKSKDVIRDLIATPSSMTLWSQTKAIKALSPRDEQFMFDSIKHLSSLLVAKKFQEAFKFMGLKFNDDALTSAKPVLQIRDAVIEMWDHMVSMEGVELQLHALKDLKFEVLGDGHLVEVTRLDGAPAILFEDIEEEIMYGIPLYFGFVNEQWRILR